MKTRRLLSICRRYYYYYCRRRRRSFRSCTAAATARPTTPLVDLPSTTVGLCPPECSSALATSGRATPSARWRVECMRAGIKRRRGGTRPKRLIINRYKSRRLDGVADPAGNNTIMIILL